MQSVDPALGLFLLQVVTFLFTLFVAWYAALQARNAAKSSQEVQENILKTQQERNEILIDLNELVKVVGESTGNKSRLTKAAESVIINSNIRDAILRLKQIRHIIECKLKKEVCVNDLRFVLPLYAEVVPKCGELSVELDSIIDNLRNIGAMGIDELTQLKQRVSDLIEISEKFLRSSREP
ncbi:MAG: hypothetical protein KGD60_11340 [Candidatus Thorarchaeota archaeon]|nr:hypothetical protein [Candidatus Thorarchaeota archaeon]